MNGKGTYLKGIRRVAEFYKCSTRTIQELVNNGTIPSYRIGRNRYFWSNEIDEALRDKTNDNKKSDRLKSLFIFSFLISKIF